MYKSNSEKKRGMTQSSANSVYAIVVRHGLHLCVHCMHDRESGEQTHDGLNALNVRLRGLVFQSIRQKASTDTTSSSSAAVVAVALEILVIRIVIIVLMMMMNEKPGNAISAPDLYFPRL